MLNSLIQDGKGATVYRKVLINCRNLELLSKKELTKNWQKSLQKRLQRCKVKDIEKEGKIRIDVTKLCREEKANEQTDTCGVILQKQKKKRPTEMHVCLCLFWIFPNINFSSGLTARDNKCL